MSAKIGRNEPCPCGSGKKYKHCCIDKEKAGPWHQHILSNEDDILKYTEFAERWNPADGPVPTFMEYMGKPNMATDSMLTMNREMQNMEFKSVEEAQAFMNRYMEKTNSTPLDDFLGLTPSQIYSLTHSLFMGNSAMIELNVNIDPALVEGLSVVRQCAYLMNALAAGEKGIKGTERGNFSRKLTQEYYDLFIREDDILRHVPSKEEDVPDLQKMKFFLTDSGLMKKQHNWFSLTKKGRNVHENFKPFELYKMLFTSFSDRIDWLSGTRYPDELKYLQNSLVFCLYILKKRASDFVTGESLSDMYKKAFPEMVRRVDLSFNRNFSIFPSAFRSLFLEEYARYLGLVERQGKRWDYGAEKALFKTTPLFNELFIWKI